VLDERSVRTKNYFSTRRLRDLEVHELARLQGFPYRRIAGWKACITERQMLGVIGEAMSIPVLEGVMVSLCRALGAPSRDRWAMPSDIDLR